jgi:hypothetical protein
MNRRRTPMKRFLAAAAPMFIVLWSGLTLAQPAVIPRIGQAPRSASETFHKLQGYFSDQAASQFKLVKADSRTRTIVATRNGIDTATGPNGPTAR